MKNYDVCVAFVEGKSAYSGTMHTDGDKLFSYGTCIAQRTDKKIIYNATKYSATTSKQQCYLRRALSAVNCQYVETNIIVPIGTTNLCRYVRKNIAA